MKGDEYDNVDLNLLIFEATAQVPKGMVTTYGDIARALGDMAASRAVGATLSHNPRPIVVPCHRVVYGDGRVGWYNGLGKGTDTKTRLLSEEGVKIVDGMVDDLEAVRFKDFHIEPMLAKLKDLQSRSGGKVITEDRGMTFNKVIGVDISYEGVDAYASSVTLDLETMRTSTRTIKTEVKFPYVPGYLSFREMPSYLELLDDAKDALVLVDGQGRLHPRRFGIASHLGLRTGLPTVGAAKSLLTGQIGADGDIMLDGETVGHLLLAGRRKYYVSVGHLVSLRSACEHVRRFLSNPSTDVLLMAHKAATQARKEGNV